MRKMMLLAVLAGCGDPCVGSDGSSLCTGTLVVDLTGEQPVFDVEGLGELAPDQVAVIASDAPCDGSEQPIWEVWSLPADSFPLAYAEVPRGGREVIAATGLDIGTTYGVYVGRHEGLIADGSATGPGAWSGLFTWGDADSFVVTPGCTL